MTIDTYNVIISPKNFYDQTINSDIKPYEEIKKLLTGQGEDCPTGCLLYYEYIKNHYRLIAVDLNRLKELDADLKAIQSIEVFWQLKKINADGNAESVLALTILEKKLKRWD